MSTVEGSDPGRPVPRAWGATGAAENCLRLCWSPGLATTAKRGKFDPQPSGLHGSPPAMSVPGFMVPLSMTNQEPRMPSVEKLSISLTPEFAADIRGAVAAGEYASTSEVIRDALRTWKQARQMRATALGELSRLWREGVESGEGTPLDAEVIKARGRARLAALQTATR